jgi:chromosome transmission fidelity protein 1
LCNVVPGGLVCFFPSFSYADQVTKSWEAAGILASIRAKKTVFIEPRTAAEVESTLERYRACITGNSNFGGICSSSGIPTSSGISLSSGASNAGLFGSRSQAGGAGKQGGRGGAVLLSVVGGKMSEGINFSDDMGRCVVMVGLPYPSKADPELQERMQYLERGLDLTQLGIAEDLEGGGKEGFESARPQGMRRGRGHEYYENLCMKAVNQSIGEPLDGALLVSNKEGSECLLFFDVVRNNSRGFCPSVKWISEVDRCYSSLL